MKDTETGRCPVTGQGGPVPADPGPKGLPILGITLDWLKWPSGMSLRVQRDHGHLARLRLLGNRCCQVSSPQAIRRILVTNANNYRRGKMAIGLRKWMGDGLITLDDDAWRAHRGVVQPMFNPEQLSAHFQYIRYGVEKQQERWDALADSGESASLMDEVNAVVARAFGKALLNKDLDDDLVQAVSIAGESIYQRTAKTELPWFIPTRYNRRLRWAQRKFDQVAKETMAGRSASDDQTDLAARFLLSDLPEKAYRHNLRTLLIAGADTTAAAFAWALWELAAHPRIRDEVVAEADRVLGDREPVEQDLASLRICRAVVDEAMRLHPPIWLLGRSANDSDVVDQWELDKDEPLLLSFFAMHRSPKYWTDPDSFDHRRFLDEDGKRAHRSGAYAPFGAGKHQCIGKDLALNTLVIGLAMLSRRYHITIDGTEPVIYGSRVSLHPHHPIWFTVRRR